MCVQCLHYWQPFPRSSSNFTRAVHAHQPPYATRACKRGVGPCARCRGRGAPGPSNARRPTRFVRPVPARRARPGPRSPSLAAISPSSEGLSGAHHADKTDFSGGESHWDFLAQWPPLLRTCGGGSRSVVHMHVLRPAAFAERFSAFVSVGPAASASMCMCGTDVGLACRRLARAMQCLWSMCENAYCMCS